MTNQTKSSSSTCRRCDAVIVWHKSRAGKYYPCNSERRNDFHSCDGATRPAPKREASPKLVTCRRCDKDRLVWKKDGDKWGLYYAENTERKHKCNHMGCYECDERGLFMIGNGAGFRLAYDYYGRQRHDCQGRDEDNGNFCDDWDDEDAPF